MIHFSRQAILTVVFLGGVLELRAKDPETTYPAKGYPWEHNTLGKAETVPAPWTPVERVKDTVRVWGREFDFGKRAWPQSISTQGRQVFSKPPKVTIRTAGGDLALTDAQLPQWEEVQSTGVALSQQWSVPDAAVDITSRVEFDGLCKVTIEVVPTGEALRLEEVSLEFRFPAEFARQYSRFVEYDFDLQRLNRADFVKSFGRLSEAQVFPFNPAVWVGNDQTGIEWACETDFGWHPRSAKEAIRLTPEGDEVVMQISVISEPLEITQPFKLTFALYPTPVKPRSPGVRAVRLVNAAGFEGDGPVPEELKVYGLALQERFAVKHTGQPGFNPPANPAAEAQIRSGLEQMRERKIRVIQYGALYGFPAVLPNNEWKDYADEWLADEITKMPRNPGWAKRAGIKPSDPSIYYVSLAPESVRDMLVWSYVQAQKSDGTRGLYFDLSSPNMLSRNPRHPYGDWVAQGGVYYPFFAQRELMMRLYRALKERDPEYLLTQHHAKVPMIVSGFTDLVLLGEGLNIFFRSDNWTPEAQATDPKAYVPDYSTLPLEIFSTEFNQNRGPIYMLLPQIQKRNDAALAAIPGSFAQFTTGLLARCAVFDVPVYGVRVEPGVWAKFAAAQAAAGWLIGADYHGPNESARFFNADSPLTRAVYISPDRKEVVVILGNFTKKDVETSMDLDLTAFSQTPVKPEASWQAIDLFHNEDLGTLAEANANPLPIPTESFRMIQLRAAPQPLTSTEIP